MALPHDFRISEAYVDLAITNGPTLREVVTNLAVPRDSIFEYQFPGSTTRYQFSCFVRRDKITRDELLLQGTIGDPGGQLYFELIYYYHIRAGSLKFYEVLTGIDPNLRRS